MSTEILLSAPPTPATERAVTIEEWQAIPHDKGAWLINGRVVYDTMPDPRHGSRQAGLIAQLYGPFHCNKSAGDHPGGWWLSLEVDMQLGGDGVRPDLCGWRRDRHLKCPKAASPQGVVTVAPDWVCEVLSPSTMNYDIEDKRAIYHRAGVGHYWLLDFERQSLMVLRHTPDGYLYVLSAFSRHIVRAEPFDDIDIHMHQLFADD